jgi:hypothetical protein
MVFYNIISQRQVFQKNLPTYVFRTFDKIKPIINTQGIILLTANPNKDENTSILEFPKYLVFIPKCLSQNPPQWCLYLTTPSIP